MEQYYDLAILALPVIGSLLLVWASIPTGWNRKVCMMLIGAILIFASFMTVFYKTYISPHENYKSGFWLFLGIYILAAVVMVLWRMRRKTVSASGPKITAPDIVPSTLLRRSDNSQRARQA
jgi:K+ transporter